MSRREEIRDNVIVAACIVSVALMVVFPCWVMVP